jgi:hypothetical protein
MRTAGADSSAALQVHGSGNLVRWLFDNQLVDEITLLTYPVVIGQGTRLFPDTGPDTALELVDSQSTPNGVTMQVYRPTGRPQYATARPTEARDIGAAVSESRSLVGAACRASVGLRGSGWVGDVGDDAGVVVASVVQQINAEEYVRW